MSGRSVKRPSDKHSDHDFQVTFGSADNDITVSICGTDPVTGHFVSMSAVFCNRGSGGGRSPKTYQSLFSLAKAMEEDGLISR
jgi:hypothetical protein